MSSLASSRSRRRAEEPSEEKAYLQERQSTFLKIYIFFSIAYAIYGLVDAFLMIGKENTSADNTFFGIVWAILLILIALIMNITALVVFLAKRFSKLTIILPIYHLAFLFIVFTYGMIKGIMAGANGTAYNGIEISLALIVSGFISSACELIFSLYLARKFRLIVN